MKQVLRELMLEWNEFELPEIKERYVNPIKYIDWNVLKIIPIIGFRRVGKTYLLLSIAKKIQKEKTVYINFEDNRIETNKLKFSDFYSVLKEMYGNKKLILLLDEIQEVPNWSGWLRTLLDRRNYQIFVSGSSSKLSSKEIPTELRGRCIPINLCPLSFAEFLIFKNLNYKKMSSFFVLKELREYLTYGGLPEIVLSEKGKKHLLIDEYFETFVVRDIFERYGIRNKEAMKVLLKLLLNSTYITVSKLYNTLKSLSYKVGKNTLLNYLSYLNQTFFVDYIQIISPSIKKVMQAPRKVYFVDNFFITKYSSKFSGSISKPMENLVYLELKRRQERSSLLTDIFYWKDYQQREVDFVVKEGIRVKELIQVTYASSRDEIERREIKSLLKAYEIFKKDKPKLKIITWDYEDILEVDGKKIEFIPLWKWLL